MSNVNDIINMNNNSKTGTNCSLHLNNMFALPLNNVSQLYLFSEHNLMRTTNNSNSITTMTATSAHITHKTCINNINNNVNSIREDNTPSPISLSSITNNINENSGNAFSISKSSRTSDGLISGLNFNHNDVLREGGFMNYQSSPADNATSTPTSFTTSSLDGYLTGGQGGHNSNHSFDLLDSDSFSEMPNSLSPSCQTTYDDNSGHSYGENKKSMNDSNTVSIKKKRKSGPTVRPSCPDCGKEFSNQSALSKHKLTHSDERKFVCTQCAKAFKRQDHLNGHLLTHRSKKPYECDVEGCEKTYCDARSLRRHKENHHPGGQSTSQSTLPAVTIIPGIALNFSTTNVGIANPSLNRIQYAPPPVATPIVPVSVADLPSAATQLQLLALQQQDNSVGNCEKWTTRESQQKWNQNSSEMSKNSLQINNEISKIKQENNKTQAIDATNNNIAQDPQTNALLHQLLTQQQFKDRQPSYQAQQQISHQISHQQIQQNQSQQHQHQHQQQQQQHHQQQQQHQQSTSALTSVQSQQDNWPYTMFSENNNTKSEPQQVECSLCQRKFKNVPALNGHMRLHGGYLKNQSQNFNNNNTINSKKEHKVDNSQIQANVKAIVDVIKEKIYRKQAAANNLVPPQPQPQPLASQMPAQQQQVIHSPMAPILSPVTPVTPTTTGATSSFNYDFNNEHNNEVQFSREDQELLYANEILLLREQLQFRMPSQPSNQNRFQQQEKQHSRRHSDSSDMIGNCNDTNNSKVSSNASYTPTPDCYSTQQFNDLLRRRTQRTCSDPGSEPIMTINTNYHSPQPQIYNQFYHQSHSVPTTPTSLYHTNSTLQPQSYPHSLPATPTAPSAPVSFVHSPQNSQRGSLPSTPTDAQQFNFIPVASPINKGSVQSQYSTSPASVAQYSPNTQYSPSHAAVPQFTYTVQPPPQTRANIYEGRIEDNYQESTMYDAISNYTNAGSDDNNISGEHFSFDNNLTSNNYYETQNHIIPDEANNLQIGSQGMEQISINSLPQPSKQQFFNNFSSTSSHDFPIVTQSSDYVQSSNCWSQSSLTNSVQMDMKQVLPLPPNLTSMVSSAIVANSNNCYSGNSSTTPFIHSSAQSIPPSLRTLPMPRSSSSPPNLVVNLEKIEEVDEETDDVFLSPVGVAPSPKRTSPSIPTGVASPKRTKHRPEPLYIPPHVNTCGYQSRLRSPRLWDPASVADTKNLSPPPYTPPPMLSPVRSGPGLFWHIISGSMTPKSGTITPKFIYARKSSSDKEKEEVITSIVSNTPTTAYEPFDCEIPETDIQPHVNIGPTFQARIPAFNKNRDEAKYRTDKADLIWDPSIAEALTEDDIESYLELSCCACIPGSGRNKEYALHLLNISKGDIHEAIVKLLEPHPTIDEGHPLVDYQYPENDIWVPQEIESYQSALTKCDKDFFSIAKEIGTKSVKQCIQFYYMWKKVCPDEYRRLRTIRRKREQETIFYNLRSKEVEESNNNNNNSNNSGLKFENDFEMDNNNETDMNGLLHSGQSSDMDDNVSSLMDSANPSPATSVGSIAPPIDYPCKLCGKVFQKVKSRSAHMKIHGSGSAKY